jgi:hypothetical protein
MKMFHLGDYSVSRTTVWSRSKLKMNNIRKTDLTQDKEKQEKKEPDYSRGLRKDKQAEKEHPDFARGQRKDEDDEEQPDYGRGLREGEENDKDPDYARGLREES